MRRFPRQRHDVSPVITTMAKPLFRYSSGRDAYVLRGVGRHIGPVLRTRSGRFDRTPAQGETQRH